jgi:hypothetical protein
VQGSDAPQLGADTPLTGTPVFVGQACDVGGAVPAATGGATIAVVERGVCTFTEKLANVEEAGGYTGPATPIQVGAVGAPLAVAAVFDGWGYVRLLDARTMRQIDTYAIEESLDPAFAEGFGDLSVHEVAVDPNRNGLAYLSCYAGGLRVLDYNRNGLREVGHYIDEGGNNFWGVEVHRLPGRGAGWGNLVLASDRDSGLWIFRYTGN